MGLQTCVLATPNYSFDGINATLSNPQMCGSMGMFNVIHSSCSSPEKRSSDLHQCCTMRSKNESSHSLLNRWKLDQPISMGLFWRCLRVPDQIILHFFPSPRAMDVFSVLVSPSDWEWIQHVSNSTCPKLLWLIRTSVQTCFSEKDSCLMVVRWSSC
jgi:hypothetical protein